jgi:hypothetical protein
MCFELKELSEDEREMMESQVNALIEWDTEQQENAL